MAHSTGADVAPVSLLMPVPSSLPVPQHPPSYPFSPPPLPRRPTTASCTRWSAPSSTCRSRRCCWCLTTSTRWSSCGRWAARPPARSAWLSPGLRCEQLALWGGDGHAPGRLSPRRQLPHADACAGCMAWHGTRLEPKRPLPRPAGCGPSLQAAGATSAKTFDLAVRMRSGQDYLFRGIPRWAGELPARRCQAVRPQAMLGEVAALMPACPLPSLPPSRRAPPTQHPRTHPAGASGPTCLSSSRPSSCASRISRRRSAALGLPPSPATQRWRTAAWTRVRRRSGPAGQGRGQLPALGRAPLAQNQGTRIRTQGKPAQAVLNEHWAKRGLHMVLPAHAAPRTSCRDALQALRASLLGGTATRRMRTSRRAAWAGRGLGAWASRIMCQF